MIAAFKGRQHQYQFRPLDRPSGCWPIVLLPVRASMTSRIISIGFPDNATIMLVAIFDLMRCQRNELGHPRETPPNIHRQDAFVNLQIFPRYYEIAEEVRRFLASNQV
jgi:hypothetical protein